MTAPLSFAGYLTAAVASVSIGWAATGHAAADAEAGVPSRADTAAVLSTPQGVVSERAEDGLFYVTGRLGKRQVRFLVDTGSTDVVLSAADASRLGAGLEDVGVARLRTAGGAAAVRKVRIKRVRLAGRVVRDITAVVAPAGAGVRVSLMGQSLLSRLGTLRISGDRLSLS